MNTFHVVAIVHGVMAYHQVAGFTWTGAIVFFVAGMVADVVVDLWKARRS